MKVEAWENFNVIVEVAILTWCYLRNNLLPGKIKLRLLASWYRYIQLFYLLLSRFTGICICWLLDVLMANQQCQNIAASCYSWSKINRNKPKQRIDCWSYSCYFSDLSWKLPCFWIRSASDPPISDTLHFCWVSDALCHVVIVVIAWCCEHRNLSWSDKCQMSPTGTFTEAAFGRLSANSQPV